MKPATRIRRIPRIIQSTSVVTILYDTIFYKPQDDPMGSKHVALLIFVLF